MFTLKTGSQIHVDRIVYALLGLTQSQGGHTPGSIALTVDSDGQKILFGQDIHGPFNEAWGSDLEQWKHSMQVLLDLQAVILCEGHFGIYSPPWKCVAISNLILINIRNKEFPQI